MKISVTIPTFNRAHLLGYAIDSVLGQTYRNFEIIVIDDGSTDGTEHLVARYGDKVRYYKQPNGGLGAARNAGLDRAIGDCIAFLDSDDYWFDFKLDLQVQLLDRRRDVSFVFTEFEILKDDGRRTPAGSRTWLAANVQWGDLYPERTSARELGMAISGVESDFGVYTGPMYRQFLHEAFVLPTTAIVRREALRGFRFTERMAIFEDWEFFARLARDRRGAFADVETAVNRGHDEPGRLTRCGSLAKAQSYLEMFERVWKADAEFRTRYPDLVTHVESAATLAVARTALLASDHKVAREALARWRRIEGRTMAHKAFACDVLTRVPFGRELLKAGIVGEKLVRRAVSGSGHGSTQVNPSA